MARKERKERKVTREKTPRTSDEKKGFLHKLFVIGGIMVLVLVIGIMIVGRFVDHPLLQMPREMISTAFAPVQEFFSGVTDTVAGYFRTLKYRSNLEYEYEQMLVKIEDLQNQAMLADQYKSERDAYSDMFTDMAANYALNPVTAVVIGHDTANYFSTLTLNRGTKDGVEDYMAVVFGGGLVGYTYDVTETTAQVKTIIDSDCTISALLESSRDQGSVKGTLSINGEAACRMYYLSEKHLPRAGDTVVTSGVGVNFPKGIPIGTVRESTRGLEGNKQYVVIEPIVDFQHLEYVIIYRYRPAYAETAQSSDLETEIELQPMATARPKPTFAVGVGTTFEGEQTTEPSQSPEASQTPIPTQSPTPKPTADPNATTPPPNLEYQRPASGTPTPTPTATPRPTATPEPTYNPADVTMEED